MKEINEIISYIVAIMSFAKDIHYNNVGYASHLLADRVVEGIDVTDDIKEQMIIAEKQMPLPSKEYLKKAAELIPDIKEDNRENWLSLIDLFEDLRVFVEEVKANKGGNALMDNLAQAINTSRALLFIETRKHGVNEAVDHDHKAATEKPIDRKECKQEEIPVSPAQKLALKYDEENLLVAENTLDELAKKLGV